MKHISFITAFLLSISVNLLANEQFYYWYKNKRMPLQQGNRWYILYDANEFNLDSITNNIEGGTISLADGVSSKWAIVDQKSMPNADAILYQSPSFISNDSMSDFFVTHRFYVKLKDASDSLLLKNMLNSYHAIIDEIDNPLWYIIRCPLSSEYSALELANIFYESNLFAASEPEFYHAIQIDCVNDPLFSSQWNLENTEQNWLDLNYCDVRSLTTGNSSIIIGVYDIGVDLNHTDINLYSYSYDVNTASSPSQIYTAENNNNYHGTACAGIIGAKANNNLGVAGIAPNCQIMSLSFYNTTAQKIRNGFIAAVNNGCSVISNSWHLATPSAYVDEGISYALSQGRNGKGCVVVFSAGNNDRDSVNYPANSNDSIIVVGAMSPCGERCNPYSCDGEMWGSNYGNALDIMAPGVIIPTTDNVGADGKNSSDYMNNFNGTSSACPHVAAIAGLMLSVNPNLSTKEVADIIDSTAQKISTNIYSYSQNSNHPNGTWSNLVGHGLVNAYAAVEEAKYQYEYYIQGQDYICNTDTVQFHLLRPSQPGETVTWSVNSGPFSFLQEYFIVGSTHNDSVWVRRNSPNSGIGQQKPLVPPTISVTITNGATSKTYTKEFRLPYTSSIPSFTASNTSSGWAAGTTRTFTITNCTDVPDYMFRWEVMKIVHYPAGTDTTYEDFDGRTLHYTPSIPVNVLGSITIKAINTKKECGTNWSSSTYGLYNPSILLTAQPEGNTLYINILEETEEELRSPAQLKQGADYSLELWHSLYGRMCTQVVQNTAEQINISGYPQGVYVLLLKENDNIIAQTKLIIQ